MRKAAEAEDRLRFAQQVESLQADVQARFARPLHGLAGLRACVAAAEGGLSPDALCRYVGAGERSAGAPWFKVRRGGDAHDLYVIGDIELLSRKRGRARLRLRRRGAAAAGHRAPAVLAT